ncbi:hypothetical protein [Sphingobacterium sp. UME9]|uniref:hypothetical protein n=1 Tax=Sphingobacterium sp. UME9 TaxID=1862316 RepID=UPI0016010223|nr:hypothetical protein [Sphingobacterium sp. UME9]MBB1644520.1 hypothetical protein [Sphingobacterium sp. UME9]
MEELHGQLVLVNPQLTYDPYLRQSQIGVITDTRLKKDEITVAFGDGKKSLYATDALLVLKPQEELYTLVKDSFKKLDEKDFVTLMEIDDRLRNGSINALAQALEIALSNQTILSISTIPLHEKLRRSVDQQQSHEKQETGRAR